MIFTYNSSFLLKLVKVKPLIIITFLYLNPIFSFAQASSVKDLALWTWFQVNANTSKKTYVSLQYEARFNHNMSQFNRSNFYFLGGYNPKKKINIELLYQFNTTYKKDFHVFYAGIMYKFSRNKFSFFYRTALQRTQNSLTGLYKYDNPINQFRARFRIQYKQNNYFKYALSAEPTIDLFDKRALYISKIRYTAIVSFQYNKYQALNMFYFFEPSYKMKSATQLINILGVTYTFTLPTKKKQFKKIFKSDIFDKEKEAKEKESRDVF